MDSSGTTAMAAPPTAVKNKKRQLRSVTEKRRIVEEALVPSASVALVARAHGVNANQLFTWRRLYLAGKLVNTRSKATTSACLLPVTVRDAGHPATVAANVVKSATPVFSSAPSGSIHVQFSKAQVRVEGSADASSLRVVLECLLR